MIRTCEFVGEPQVVTVQTRASPPLLLFYGFDTEYKRSE